MDFFKLKEFDQKAKPLSSLQQDIENVKPNLNMPTFEPKGNFFLKNKPVNEDIDHKLKIFDLEKSKYFLRKVG